MANQNEDRVINDFAWIDTFREKFYNDTKDMSIDEFGLYLHNEFARAERELSEYRQRRALQKGQ